MSRIAAQGVHDVLNMALCYLQGRNLPAAVEILQELNLIMAIKSAPPGRLPG